MVKNTPSSIDLFDSPSIIFFGPAVRVWSFKQGNSLCACLSTYARSMSKTGKTGGHETVLVLEGKNCDPHDACIAVFLPHRRSEDVADEFCETAHVKRSNPERAARQQVEGAARRNRRSRLLPDSDAVRHVRCWRVGVFIVAWASTPICFICRAHYNSSREGVNLFSQLFSGLHFCELKVHILAVIAERHPVAERHTHNGRCLYCAEPAAFVTTEQGGSHFRVYETCATHRPRSNDGASQSVSAETRDLVGEIGLGLRHIADMRR